MRQPSGHRDTGGGHPRVLLVSPMIAPSRNPVFNALARQEGVDLRVLYLCRRHRRQWSIHLDEIHHPFSVLSHGGLRQESLTWGGLLPRRMVREPFDVVILSGYDHPAYMQAMVLGRALRRKVILWSVSTALDARRGGGIREAVKRRLVGLCDGYFAPGAAASEYLEGLGARRDRIQIVPHVVDGDLFRRLSDRYGRDRQALKRMLGLPEKVILFVGRIHRGKGVGDLLDAFRGMEANGEVGLVLAGGGPALGALRRRGRVGVHLPGFIPRDRLPMYLAAADIFVLPTWSDTWGLVVNEAMAAGLPVVVSSVAGCARDLLRSGENGFVYPVRDVGRLRAALESLLERPDLRRRMGEASRRIIAGYTPEAAARAMREGIRRVLA